MSTDPETYTYTARKPPLPESTEELRARIPGWGADLDPADRPSVPKLQVPDPTRAGAHWDLPERQPEERPRERSIEHGMLTPAFGTAQPLRGLSGVIRRYAYRRFSEGRAAHWLLLIAADRVDVRESRMRALLSGKPDLLVTETGIKAELTHGGASSRFGQGRSDVKHQWIDPIVVVGPRVAAGWVAYKLVRRLLPR